jgi:myo-inositol-1(or 4)-monophosphatase
VKPDQPIPRLPRLQTTLLECVRAAGQILRDQFAKPTGIRSKGEPSSIVTDADLESERWIIDRIRRRFPGHSIVAEETGYQRRESEFTWVIDPLDGTSNFAAGLPWFGVQIAVLHRRTPILAAMYLPILDLLYVGARGRGVQRNGQTVRVTAEPQLGNVLCAFGVDARTRRMRRQMQMLQRVINAVRNVRATNCLLDFGYTLDGRLGACLNFNTKIWDIAPVCLMLPEAGGRLTDLDGRAIRFRLDTEPFDRSYTVLGARPALHAQLRRALRGAA